MLYQTGVEYGDYTMNHVQGCAHGCKYPCYAFLMKKRFGQIEDYESWLEPMLVSNTLELLDKEPAVESPQPFFNGIVVIGAGKRALRHTVNLSRCKMEAEHIIQEEIMQLIGAD